MTDQPNILVVDDNEDLLDTFAMILKRRGFHVETAGNGVAAVAKFREKNYDITLMDNDVSKVARVLEKGEGVGENAVYIRNNRTR